MRKAIGDKNMQRVPGLQDIGWDSSLQIDSLSKDLALRKIYDYSHDKETLHSQPLVLSTQLGDSSSESSALAVVPFS